ncbi:hypothetical protein LUZ60_003277 [Juncus effusus]|nr:hypothetical protein LUZ60_003277 [Juncus effusus]
MAENGVILALAKVASAFGDDGLNFGILSLFNIFLTLTSLPNCMQSIENELLVMKGFLSQIDSRQFNDEAFNAWLGQVRKLACMIEDTMDEYIFLIHKQSGNGFFNFVKRVFNVPFVLFEMWSISNRLKRLKIELIRISQVKDRWVHMVNNEFNMVQVRSFGGNINQSYFDDFVKEEELVGIERNREKLVNLIQIKEKSLHVITVWGMGGLGKTTLVNNVYKREILTFDCHAWISISQSYNIHDLLRKLIVQLFEEQNDQNPSDIHMMDCRILKETLKMLLEHKCYLIVLDDVWNPDVYDKLREFFPENGLGSRIIITTRINEVALLANEFCKLEIKPLDEYDSYYLFCKKAFWKDKKHLCPPKLDEWARKFVKKCKGLPLALVSIDYIMKRSRIVRLWIGEGFVEERGSSKLEEIAEGYLTELLQRSLLQLVEKNSFGRVRLCKMHDIVRELAISLSRKECFHEVYDENSGVPWGEFENSFTRRARFCVQLCDSLKELWFLSKLEIFARNEDEVLQLEYLNPLPSNLKKLHINGKLAERTLDSPFFLDRAKNLKVFDLGWSQLDENPFLSLSKMTWLTTMRLVRVYNGNSICFRAGWFPNMKILVMKDFLNIDKVEFEEGTLMNLTWLRFEGFKELIDLPNGIGFLKSLEKLFLLELHVKFRSRYSTRTKTRGN